ncbi:MAG TPA: type I restriction enzyme HsdR N-terminal domain-containing protein [Bacteroidales bacterium]|jgi:hypothetical protein|nr:MAG: hypothetical protein BWX96_02283 [Bacteroidetes bacterium ADurb.Bin145]HQG64030.1 type I restriction enzyme HsdR N-terminal domain-containing protein [Bacteroidales bacterium]
MPLPEYRNDISITCPQKYKTKLKELNLPAYSFRIATQNGKEMIFDPMRRKYVRLTPEEWVRQNFVQYLVHEGKYPLGLIGTEVSFVFNRLKKRADILVHNRMGEPVMVVECKSPDVRLDDEVFDQIATYNLQFRVPYLVVTNGMVHYACRFDTAENKYKDLLAIPFYSELIV